MITKISTSEELKSLISEIFFNKQSIVTKISDESVLNASFFAIGRVGQKAMKEIALVESIVSPQSASGSNLDNAANLFSSITRNTSSGSSTYLLLVGDAGTVYPVTATFTSNTGIEFELTEEITIGTLGYGYGKVRSVDTGSKTNVDANTIINVTPQPVGHIVLTNEFKATGGRDSETDDDLRRRILSHNNIVAKQTLANLLEVFREENEDILMLQNLGMDTDGYLNIVVVLQNGADLTSGELSSLLDSVDGYFALSDQQKIGDTIGIKLLNPTWYEVGGDIGIDFRVSILSNYDVDQVRKNIQIALSRYLDIRNWQNGNKIEWDDLLTIVKKVEGVNYVPDNFFNPSVDEIPDDYELPRISRFIMRDLDGNIITDTTGVLSPIFYPNL